MHPTACDRVPTWRESRPDRLREGRRIDLRTLLLLAALWLVPGTAAAVQNITFLGQTVRATGVTPGGWTVFMGTGRSPGPWLARSTSWLEPVVDTAGRGRADFVLGSPVPEKSIWAAVDGTTGALAVAAPAGYVAQAATVDPLELFATTGFFEDRRERIELLIVRPGVGAYFGRFSDGVGREGIADGEIRVPLSALGRLWPEIGALPGLSTIQPGDVVVGIDPVAMTYYAFEYPAP